MKQLINIIVLIVLSCTTLLAQPKGERFEKIHAIKVAYITDKINLTPEQAERFWPVYNRYGDEMRAVRRAYKEQQGNAMRSIDEDIEAQEKILNLRKKYKDEFLKVISAQQLSQLYDAEREFKKMLIQQLKQRRGNPNEKR